MATKASPFRIAAGALSLSAAGFLGIVMSEGYTDTAVIPTKGDRPTVGFGSTFRADGSPVKIGDKTTPVRALATAKTHIDREEQQFRDSIPDVKLTQGEYDLYLDFTYQYGLANWRSSSMRKYLQSENYRAACDALLMWRKADGFDCSTPGNTRCPGVWTRQQERHAKCIAEQGT